MIKYGIKYNEIYSEEEIDFIKNNYLKYTNKELAVIMNRPYTGLVSKIYDLKLRKMDAMPEILKDKDFLNKEYIENCKSIKQISFELKIPHSKVKRALSNLNLLNLRQKTVDLTNKKFYYWTVLRLASTEECQGYHFNNKHWICKCKCGKTEIIHWSILTKGELKSCGCSTDNRTKIKKYQEISYNYFNVISKSSKSRGLKFLVTIKELWNLFVKQDKKCIFSGEKLTFEGFRNHSQTASLDRIDSNKDYTIDNVQWVHKSINKMKQSMPDEDFLIWIKKIYLHRIS